MANNLGANGIAVTKLRDILDTLPRKSIISVNIWHNLIITTGDSFYGYIDSDGLHLEVKKVK